MIRVMLYDYCVYELDTTLRFSGMVLDMIPLYIRFYVVPAP